MYIVGFVIPVPERKMEAYQDWSRRASELLIEYGCIEVLDSWEDNIAVGAQTDFRRVVDIGEGEKVDFC